jgi:hypothetical protein
VITVRATLSASTVGTSWTRRIVAPRSNAATAAATLARQIVGPRQPAQKLLPK